MKIALDCSLVCGERAGVGQYSYELACALADIDSENRYVLYVLAPALRGLLKKGLEEAGLPQKENFELAIRKIPAPFQLMRYLAVPGLGAYFREYSLGGIDADVFHSTSFCVPRFKDRKKRIVTTIYDLTVVTNPECHKGMNVAHCLAGMKEAIKYSDAIIAISEHTKKDIIRHLGAPEDMITVTHLAAGRGFRPVRDAAALSGVRRRLELPEKFILFLGSLEPRKNVGTLLRAYAALPEAFKKEFHLVIAGARGWLNGDIPKVIGGLKIADKVHFPGYIDRADLSAVYSLSSVFVYPSLYEGFGLPILEAFACGAPVICSNTSSMPEAAADAALMVSPLDAGEISSALEKVLYSDKLKADMRSKGMKRAAGFTWERCARETLGVYERVCR